MPNSSADIYVVAKVTMKEGHVLFNEALDTFYLRLYGVRQMVKDHSDSERRNPAAATWATLSDLVTRVLLNAPSHRQDSTAFVTPVVEHWLEKRNSSMGPP